MVLVFRWQRDAKTFTFFLNDLVCEPGVGVGPLEDGRYAKSGSDLERAQRLERPAMDDIDLPRKPRQLLGNEVVVNRAGAHVSHDPVGQPQLAPGERRVTLDSGRKRLGQTTREDPD